MHHLLAAHKPKVIILDPISGLIPSGSDHDVNALVLRIVDHIKGLGATGFFTSVSVEDDLQSTALNISSLVDSWLLLRNLESNGERNRLLYVLKSRGMAHSNQIREFLLTSKGVRLRDVYLGPGGVLTGSARVAQEAAERRDEIRIREEAERRYTSVRASLRSLDAKIAALEAERKFQEEELALAVGQDQARKRAALGDREELGRSRVLSRLRPKAARVNGRESEL
jgi:circadian clock protein KaiC